MEEDTDTKAFPMNVEAVMVGFSSLGSVAASRLLQSMMGSSGQPPDELTIMLESRFSSLVSLLQASPKNLDDLEDLSASITEAADGDRDFRSLLENHLRAKQHPPKVTLEVLDSQATLAQKVIDPPF